ncbi:MAG: dihydroorotate dehydrogenase [Candidatus Lokiarchaeota archaeon]|nr:dihydroorotate dehydrogenase [Candidatus Lokiarchaeota archaeon]
MSIAGLRFKSPLILASGILGVSPSTMHILADYGMGGVTTKSIGPIKTNGYKNPSIIGLNNDTFLNAVGLANPGISAFEHEISEIKTKERLVVIVSVFGRSPQEFANVAYLAEQAGADAIEMNISCPHDDVSTIGVDPNLTYKYVNTVRKRISCPLFVKLTPNVTDITKIGQSAEKAGADALVAINTVSALAIDIHTKRPILSHGIGGLSGKAIKPIGIKHVYTLFKSVSIPIIGCGGIFAYEDVIEYFFAGASAVQLGSCLYYGYDIITKIHDNLFRYMETHEYNTISELTGLAHTHENEG